MKLCIDNTSLKHLALIVNVKSKDNEISIIAIINKSFLYKNITKEIEKQKNKEKNKEILKSPFTKLWQSCRDTFLKSILSQFSPFIF